MATLEQILADDWQWRLADSPEFATAVGVHDFNDRLDDRSPASFAAREAHCRQVIEQLDALDEASRGDLNARLLRHQCQTYVEGARFRSWLMCVNNIETPATELAQLVSYTRFESAADYETFLARLACVPAQLAQTTALLRLGLAEGLVLPRVCVENVPAQLEAFAGAPPRESPLFKPFAAEGVDAALADRAAAALADVVLPAFAALHEFMRDEYVPNARTSIAASDLPDGPARYACCIQFHVSQPMDAQSVHDTGLAEVERILGEMRACMAEAGFEGSLHEYFEHLRTAPEQYWGSAEELLAEYRRICEEAIAPQLPRLFGRLPRAACAIVPTPAHQADDAPAAYYLGPAADGSRPGTFFANTSKLEARPKYEQEALALHECQPGHHTQTALAAESADLPKQRALFDDRRYWEAPSRFPFETAYIEGWGLYSESLGRELGLYADPVSYFGRLSMEIFRALRLVVDTGMHALGWTRQQAVDFMAERSGLSQANIEAEVTRYICWPGQALAYKLGEIEFQRLRREAQQARGEQWDVRAFHDLIMATGAAPMSIIEALVGEQTAAVVGGSSSSSSSSSS